MRTVSHVLTRLRSNQRGTVAVVFALSALVLIMTVGLAVDGGRAYSVSSKLKAAADAAALAGAKLLDDDDATDSDIEAVATTFFQAQIANLGINHVSVALQTVEINRDDSSVTIDANVSVGTPFAQVAQIPSIDFDVSSTVVYKIKRVELAMVLDVTGSMNTNGKLDGMKAAAEEVIDTLLNPYDGKNNRISLVPYSAAVNVDTYRDTASGGDSLDGCIMERLEATHRDDDFISGAPNNYAVNGQLNSGSNTRYTCPPAVLMPLSKDAVALKAMVNSYGAAGWTAGHIGLAWGWNTVSPNWAGVFTGNSAPGDYGDDNYIKAVILMTDGVFNTSYSAGTSDAEQKDESSARTLALCDNMKTQNIRIYTVAFEAPAEADTLLRSCASDPANHFGANSNAELRAAFLAIVENLRLLRLTK